jgi:hypothetical protein
MRQPSVEVSPPHSEALWRTKKGATIPMRRGSV